MTQPTSWLHAEPRLGRTAFRQTPADELDATAASRVAAFELNDEPAVVEDALSWELGFDLWGLGHY
ncbi:hypothetical protein EH244_30905 [Variovorax beijingensis]|uniref:Uncharacterized protein n=1 Tax=Variovorax beijingensis TaxID=2496117 RepID=A0A3P3E2A9_9BURK|nr:hypothetical protein [Variovorax beijingensis]RRH80196.1 hypothetical protein EH244_30905 [Variovorax beijingensis]